ncbi:LEA type 2 family protein [Petrimonas sp.]|uniref:LEA type 2 family protein n=1 Tax=Petrimonas sp. TaxID=2023866 RepID=UPI003F50F376
MKKTFLLSLLIFALTSCDVLNQIGGAIQLSQCEYKYNSITDMQLAGINLGDGSSISLSNFASLSSILTGGSLQTIPFSMTLNMDVTNPNQAAAFLNALEYAIEINEMEFTTGKMDVPIRVESGQTTVLPLSIGVDLKNLMNRYSRDRVAKEMSGFLGLSSDETKVTVKLWPKLLVGNTPIRVPAPIPVVFTFGGDK